MSLSMAAPMRRKPRLSLWIGLCFLWWNCALCFLPSHYGCQHRMVTMAVPGRFVTSNGRGVTATPAKVTRRGHTLAVVSVATVSGVLFQSWLRRQVREWRRQATLRSLLAAHPGKEEQVRAIAKNGEKLSEADAELQSDQEMVKTAVLQSGSALRFAPEKLRADPSVVKIAVAQDGYALEYAANGLSGDPEMVKVACAQNGYALQYASEELRSDKEVVMIAVSQVPYAFQYASEALRSDPSIVRVVVGKRGACLEFASEALRKDREIVRKAVANNCNALQYASEELQADPELQRVGKKAEERNAFTWACLMAVGRFFAIVQKVKLKLSSGGKGDEPGEKIASKTVQEPAQELSEGSASS